MNDPSGKDLFNKKFTVERPVPKKRAPKNKPFYETIPTNQANPKNNANLIGILVTVAGSLGIHDFVCGNYRNGTLKIIFSFFGILFPISIAWSIVDCYRIGKGTYKPQRDFPLVAVPWCKKVAIIEAILYFTIAVFIFRQVVRLFSGM